MRTPHGGSIEPSFTLGYSLAKDSLGCIRKSEAASWSRIVQSPPTPKSHPRGECPPTHSECLGVCPWTLLAGDPRAPAPSPLSISSKPRVAEVQSSPASRHHLLLQGLGSGGRLAFLGQCLPVWQHRKVLRSRPPSPLSSLLPSFPQTLLQLPTSAPKSTIVWPCQGTCLGQKEAPRPEKGGVTSAPLERTEHEATHHRCRSLSRQRSGLWEPQPGGRRGGII